MRPRIRALSRLEMPGDCRARRWTAKLVTGALRAADLLLCRATMTTVPTCMCVAPLPMLSSRTDPSAPKRLRFTSRNLRMSQASTMPAVEFDLTRADSDLDMADQSKQTGHTLNHGWVELQVLRSKLWDEAPSEVDGASSVSGVDLSDAAEEEILEMDRFPLGGVRVGLASLDTVNVVSDEECSQVSRGPVPFGVAVGSAGDSSNRYAEM